jgi:hypothetical protein
MTIKWYKFNESKGSRQKRPAIRKLVVVRLQSKDPGREREALAIGYRKDGAGDPQYPYFVIPGIGGTVIEWCDCLPDNFEWHSEDSAYHPFGIDSRGNNDD